jgi:hypothetical protein
MTAAKGLMLAGMVATCALAAHASAAPAPPLFRLSITGTAHAEWDHSGAPTPFEGCDRTVRSEGIRNVRFRTAVPALVRVVNGKLSAATVRGLTGTVTLGGANTTTDVCATGQGSEAIADCAQTKRGFKKATIAVVGGGGGTLTLRPVRNARLRTSNCPREPLDVVRAPLGPLPGPLRFSKSALTDDGVARITLHASKTGTVNYGPLETGRLAHRSVWKITLERVDE